MIIKSSEFVKSAQNISQCPPEKFPEYAFIGRSNVGKSSLINMLTERKGLAKTSVTPGKTQLLNYYLVNNLWHLVDLPGLGYAKVSKKQRSTWRETIFGFLKNRRSLLCTFLLVDSRHEPQNLDVELMEWMAVNQLPFVLVFTKIDKLSRSKIDATVGAYKETLLKTWEELPQTFITSSETKAGREDILSFIDETNNLVYKGR